MLSEHRVRELGIRWYFLALHCRYLDDDTGKAAPVFAKAHAYIAVLGFPSSISCGKKSEDGLKKYVEILLEKWKVESVSNEGLVVGEWLSKNVSIYFEDHI